MANHFMLSMLKVPVISFEILTIQSSVNVDWFIRSYRGELELDVTS